MIYIRLNKVKDEVMGKRYKILKFIDTILGIQVERCERCGAELDAVEKYYYDCYCEKCERIIQEQYEDIE